MKRQNLILIGLLSVTSAHVTPEVLLKHQIDVKGVVVASSCSVVVESDSSRSGVISFGEYNQAQKAEIVNKSFTVKLFESGTPSSPGCSAFLAGSGFVSVKFGDQGQLDERGVVTRGGGDNIRIEVRATDPEASNRDPVTSENSVLMYSKEFAQKGIFGFEAEAKGLDTAMPGAYRGSLSLVVSYK